MVSRFVGRSAEKRFSALCSDAGVTCNPAQEDEYGWDHVIQFPRTSVAGVPADLQRAPPPVFVQTKAHEQRQPNIRMKLSNALALARSPNPCFVVLACGDNSREFPSWRAVHFWQQMIAQTLKRARKAARDGIAEDSFHKKFITFRLTDADSRSAEELLPWIERTVTEVGDDYAAAKTVLLTSVGFEPERHVGRIEFAPMSSVEELIDHQLGLTETLPVGKFELSDRRFGIEVKLPIPEASNAFATLHAHPQECQVRVRGPDGFQFEQEGELILSSLPGLPVDQWKARIRTEFLDVVWGLSGGRRFSLKYSTGEKRPPPELEQLLRFVSWLGMGKIDFQVWKEDQKLLGGSIDADPPRDQPAYKYLSQLASTLAQLSRHLRTRIPEISIEDIVEAERLQALHSFLTAPDMRATARLKVEITAAHVEEAVTYGFAKVGDWSFGALTRWRISEQSSEGDLLESDVCRPTNRGVIRIRAIRREGVEHVSVRLRAPGS